MNNPWNLDITAEREFITKISYRNIHPKTRHMSNTKMGKLGLKIMIALIIPFNINAIIISVIEIYL